MSRVLASSLVALLTGLAGTCPSRASEESRGAPAEVKLTLREVVQTVLSRAPELLLADSRVRRANEAVREARSLNLPQVVAGTGLAYNNGYPLSLEGAAPAIFEVGVSQSIFNKRNQRLILEAEEGGKATQTGAEIAKVELAAAAALAYYELHEARKSGALWFARLESCLRRQETLEARLEAGKVRPLDVLVASTATSQTRQQLLVAREQAFVAETQLKLWTGISEASRIVTEEPILASDALSLAAETLYNRALEASPDIRQAEAALRAREHRVEAEKGETRPRLNLVGEYALFSKVNNYQDYFNQFSRNNFLLGLSIQVPLFDGHRSGARVAQSRHEADEARLRLQQLRSQLRMDLERSSSAIRVAQGAVKLATQEVAAAEEHVRVQESLFEAGRAELHDLESARDQVREKELGRIGAERALFKGKIDLLRLCGALAPLF